MRLLDLPAKLDRYGVPHDKVRDWESRGSEIVRVEYVLVHATVSAPGRAIPSLDIVTNGRGGPSPVPGPLYNTLGGRDHKTRIIAAGKSNNAGKGGIYGITGNSRTAGFALEHTNIISTEDLDADDFEFVCRNAAALADGHVGASRVGMHWTWAGGSTDPAGAYRKSDLLQRVKYAGRELNEALRDRVAVLLLAGGVGTKPPVSFFPSFAGELREGMRGRKVAEWKYALAANGYGAFMSFKGSDAEEYGSGTTAAVRKLQSDRNALHLMAGGSRSDLWDVTGRTGPKTWGYLRWLDQQNKAANG